MSRTILIVEDETAIADTLTYALRADGFVPHHVTLGQQALDWLQNGDVTRSDGTPPDGTPPALIILDVGLPDISGFEVCRRLRQFSNIPVIFLTARSDEIDRIVGLEIGADDYVSKPFSPRELVARIRAVLRRPPVTVRMTTAATTPMAVHTLPESSAAASAAALPATPTSATIPPLHTMAAANKISGSGFELRNDEGRILYLGQDLTLTRYEYLLLKTLVERPGMLFSRAQLMDKVWSNAPETQERTVDAHVKSIRAKLKHIAELRAQAGAPLPASPDDPIQTHRGMGYSLVRQ